MSGKRLAVSGKLRIGVFDSGVGSYLVAAAIQREIPDANIVIKTDPEFFPYGNKSPGIIQQRLVHFAKESQKERCQIVVIACNSATTNGIMSLRRKFPELQFVGIEPPVKPIVKLTKTGKVAVMGTEATMKSAHVKRLIQRYADGVKIHPISCPGLAELIEEQVKKPRPKAENGHIKYSTTFYNMNYNNGRGSDVIPRSTRNLYRYRFPIRSGMTERILIKKFLDQPISDGVDVIGLACTHYPYILPLMKKLYPNVTFYDPTEAVVERVNSLVSRLSRDYDGTFSTHA